MGPRRLNPPGRALFCSYRVAQSLRIVAHTPLDPAPCLSRKELGRTSEITDAVHEALRDQLMLRELDLIERFVRHGLNSRYR